MVYMIIYLDSNDNQLCYICFDVIM